MLSQATAPGRSRQVKVCLAADRRLHALNTASEIKESLAVGEFVEAWQQLKGWYRLAEDRAPKACPEMLASQTVERVALYTVAPPDITPIPVPDKPLTDPEIREVVAKLQNSHVAGVVWST
jgi:hypothetical protein